jgi:hypothetical protein
VVLGYRLSGFAFAVPRALKYLAPKGFVCLADVGRAVFIDLLVGAQWAGRFISRVSALFICVRSIEAFADPVAVAVVATWGYLKIFAYAMFADFVHVRSTGKI